MKHWKSKLLLLMLLSGLITVMVSFNYSYWAEMAPIYLKGLVGKLPSESDGLKLPPLPNPFVNNQTILGLDEDKNGIRDDVDYWIAVNGVNYNERMAIREKMKVEQKLIYYAEKEDFDGFQDAMRDLWVANKCQNYISYSYHKNKNRILLGALRDDFLYNTESRSNALVRIAKNGYLYEAPLNYKYPDSDKKYEYCQFKIMNIPQLVEDYDRAIYRERKKWGYEK